MIKKHKIFIDLIFETKMQKKLYIIQGLVENYIYLVFFGKMKFICIVLKMGNQLF